MLRSRTFRCVVVGLAIGLTLPAGNAWALDEADARRIGEKEAGCGPAKPCETRARLDNGRWVVIVSFIRGYRENGEAIFRPGDWRGYMITKDGKVIDRMPGL